MIYRVIDSSYVEEKCGKGLTWEMKTGVERRRTGMSSYRHFLGKKTEENVLTWELKTGVKRRTDTSNAKILGHILHLGSQSRSGKTVL